MKTELKNIINESALNKNDKNIWRIFIAKVSEKEIEPILEVLKEDKKFLRELTKKLKEDLRKGLKEKS